MCEYVVKSGWCLIDGECREGNEALPVSGGCARCKPTLSQSDWSVEKDGVSCDDGDVCTKNDACQGGHCVGEPVVCDDGLVCTKDWCDLATGACVHEREADWCLIEGKCYLVDTSPSGPDGTCRVCDPYNSPTAWAAVNEGKGCDDGDGCTNGERCVSGACVALGAPCDDGVECTQDVCHEGECSNPVMSGWCLIAGECFAGNAQAPGNPCLACKPVVLQTGWTPVNEGGACDDGLWCTVGDECDSGVCGGSPRECGAGECQESWCSEEKQECVVEWLEDGVLCDDGDLCTEHDQCESGRCAGIEKDCSDVGQGNVCVRGYCDPLDGDCKAEAVSEGEACDDGLWCTVGGKCVGGLCTGQARVCSDQCNDGMCDEENDVCVKTPANEGEACDDKDFCTTGERCSAGECGGGVATDCSSLSDVCNEGMCSKEKQKCLKKPKPDGTDCLSDPPPEHWVTAECQGGKCVATSCEWPYENCGVVEDCSINLLTNAKYCGDCETSCGAGSCVEGECTTALQCPEGLGDCDGNSANGCETRLRWDVDNCGECGNTCTVAHGGGICEGGQCKVLYCDPGWGDQNGQYEDGCEGCVAIVDGSVEVPDDGEDNDCTGGDAENAESRGYYVDGSFTFDAACPEPGQGTRGCPFREMLWALYTAQFEQDWSNPLLVKREIYIAKGEYVDSGIVADLSKPLMVLGGYERTASGPWVRDIEANKTILRSTSTVAVVAGPDVEGWAVLDGLVPTPQVNVRGKVVMKRISTSTAHPLTVVSDSGKAVLWMASCSLTGDNMVGGSVKGGQSWTLTNNTIQGNVEGWDSWTLTNNTIQGDVGGVPSWTLTNNTIQGNVSGWSGWTLTNNIIQGDVEGSYSWTLTNNTIFLPSNTLGPAIKMTGNGWRLVNNTIVRSPTTSPPCQAVREDNASADPTVVRNNAFVAFSGAGCSLYLDEGTTTITNVLALNMMSQLPSCGRGGNIALADLDAAKFESQDPASPAFLVPAADSPLVDAGLGLPLTCGDSTIEAPTTDILGQPVPCGTTLDIGAYEYCPP